MYNMCVEKRKKTSLIYCEDVCGNCIYKSQRYISWQQPPPPPTDRGIRNYFPTKREPDSCKPDL